MWIEPPEVHSASRRTLSVALADCHLQCSNLSGNNFCGTISSTFRATPDGKGVRLQPDISTSLPACSGILSLTCLALPCSACALDAQEGGTHKG